MSRKDPILATQGAVSHYGDRKLLPLKFVEQDL